MATSKAAARKAGGMIAGSVRKSGSVSGRYVVKKPTGSTEAPKLSASVRKAAAKTAMAASKKTGRKVDARVEKLAQS